MSMTHATDIVSVWTDKGRPIRLVWRGTRYVVTDRPTPLQKTAWHDALTHPAGKLAGWRFQGCSVADGDVRMFDVRPNADGGWDLLRTYS
ncbi:hypothetical protein [Leifsonia sp. PS1209]|uniref:hypothetical protein n=1 Tax=Leifsonia sp. PS1209 TaxID=2724914 RepID=UPI001FF9CA5C|nr:hypothetical protein [Leifsonia sp. PS1209]